MSDSKFQDYRLKITRDSTLSGPTYIVRRAPSRDIMYISGNEQPYCLSNLVQQKAAELRFSLQDALTGAEAAKAVRAVLAELWHRNTRDCPKVEVLP